MGEDWEWGRFTAIAAESFSQIGVEIILSCSRHKDGAGSRGDQCWQRYG